jgi:hypothetical protein
MAKALVYPTSSELRFHAVSDDSKPAQTLSSKKVLNGKYV